MTGSLFGPFSVIAFALAPTELYGMLARSVGQRTSEIGVRLALGARPLDILRQFLREAAALVGLGIGLGIIVGAALGQAMRVALYGVSPSDPATLVALPALLALAALLATCGPARRAMRLQPVEALRYE